MIRLTHIFIFLIAVAVNIVAAISVHAENPEVSDIVRTPAESDSIYVVRSSEQDSGQDSRLVQTTSVSAKGLGTGSVTYNSEGGKSMSAIYYDIRGNVTSLREITDFGTLRVTDNTYPFTNQPLTIKMTESGGVTMLTENTYDTSSGLHVATDVTVNGVKQRVSKVTYDDLGRIAFVVQRHGLKADGNYGKIDNLHISYNGNRITTVPAGPEREL